MNLAEMRTLVRRDLHDEDTVNYRWSDDEIDRHITRAVRDFSVSVPRPQRAAFATTAGSREIDISSLSDRVMVEAVEYPVDKAPPYFPLYSLRGDTVTFLEDIPDGSDCYVYYGSLHTLDTAGSTIPRQDEDLVAAGAAAYAALEWSAFAINRVTPGGTSVSSDFLAWGRERLDYFKTELKRLDWKNKVRSSNINSAS